MAIGERIHYFRKLRGLTMRKLGMMVGFPEKSADVRLAQYENGSRSPKADLTANLAHALDVSPKALDVPDIDSYIGLMHTLFALEDLYGLKIDTLDGEAVLRLDKSKGQTYLSMFDLFSAWAAQAEKLKTGEITKEEYDRWRYHYPELDTDDFVKVPSEELSKEIACAVTKI
ncbi:MAG: helix-turn-helix transcriptional regulator [Lachnospiraceae bacterium]|nr:helix-turn-helix transcriptional regulator [Lachnospiraceae bacterium]